MQRQGLFEAPTKGCHYTWSDKHQTGGIYSRIDRIIGNVQWFQDFHDAFVEVLLPNISDHSLIRVSRMDAHTKRKYMFKFLNRVTKKEGYQDIVKERWEQRVHENASHRLWQKIKTLQDPIKHLQRSFTDIQTQILQARQELNEAQHTLMSNMFDCYSIENVKRKIDKVIELNQMEESILNQKAKVDWLMLGDGNNFFPLHYEGDKQAEEHGHPYLSQGGDSQ